MQKLCLEGKFLNIFLVEITSWLPIIAWIQPSYSLLCSCKTPHRSHSEVPIQKQKSKANFQIPNEGINNDARKFTEFSKQNKHGAASLHYQLFMTRLNNKKKTILENSTS